MRQIILKHHFYFFFDETNFKSTSILIKYKSINTSFNESFKTQNMTNFQCQKRFSNVNDEIVKIFAEFSIRARF